MKNVLVTPTFAPDYERCKAMLHSSERWVTGVEAHLLIVDPRDIPLFKTLETSRVQVVSKTEVLPMHLIQLPLQRRWWLAEYHIPVRGWILQQIIKLAVAQTSDADAVIFADSDLIFVRPIDLDDLWHQDLLRLFKTTRGPKQYTDKRYQNWYRNGCDALGIADPSKQSNAYITQLATMRPELVRRMLSEMETRTGRAWYQHLSRTWDFSEYVLYGLYVDQLDEASSGHYFTEYELCHSSWRYSIKTQADITAFMRTARQHHCALHLQSNLGFSADALDHAVNQK